MTIRLSEEEDSAITSRAKALGRTRSDVVRDLIARGLQDQPVGRRIAHLRGRLGLPAAKGGWRKQLRERNWR
jgi:hypothetical protein